MNSRIDYPLLSAILMICGIGLIVLFSAGGEDVDKLIKHGVRLCVAFIAMYIVAQLPPRVLSRWSVQLYLFGLVLLFVVLTFGIVNKGAQRWINLGLFSFQPSEIMKIAVPMMTAWILARSTLPPKWNYLALAVLAVLTPFILIVMQPDLGTALLIVVTGLIVIFVAGISWQLIVAVIMLLAIAAPALWAFVLHDYQKERVLTLFDPWSDPLGTGYHTVQSIIAIGSGGIRGKGWLSGTQSHLEFIPERSTDFIFSVFGEEFGMLGALLLLLLYLFLVLRGIWISLCAADNYSKLLAAGITVSFFFYVFVNIGMVSGILPVVGVPLPLISYGGTSIVTLMVGFGILMSISCKNKYISNR